MHGFACDIGVFDSETVSPNVLEMIHRTKTPFYGMIIFHRDLLELTLYCEDVDFDFRFSGRNIWWPPRVARIYRGIYTW